MRYNTRFFIFFIGLVLTGFKPYGQQNKNEEKIANLLPQKNTAIQIAISGRPLFSDQQKTIHQLPDVLSGLHYTIGSMIHGNKIVPVTTGLLYIVTPLKGEAHSQEVLLLEKGFTKMDIPSFKLYKDLKEEIGVFVKNIEFEKFRLPYWEYNGWAIPFFKSSILPSFTSAANIISSPGKNYEINTRLWQGCPSIEKTGNRLWSAWFSGGSREPAKGNYGIISFSDDGGNQWVDPALIITHPDSNVRVMDPQLWKDPDGRLWIFWVQNTGAGGFDGVWGTWAVHSDNPEDDNPLWSSPKRLCDGLTRNKPLVLTTGQWLLPSYNWAMEYQSAVYISTDKGTSWALQGGPVNDPVQNFYEHMLVQKKDGSVWMLQRNIQESFSLRLDKDWSALKSIDGMTSANSRLYISRLQSGNLLLIYNNDPEKKTRKNLTAFLSEDDGKTWPFSLVLDERDEVSYPDATQDANGLIFVCYDRSRGGEKEILMTTFKEDDIKSGSYFSAQSVQKRIISKSTNNAVK